MPAAGVENKQHSPGLANPADGSQAKEKAGPAGTGTGNKKSSLELEMVADTLDPGKWSRCAATTRAFNEMTQPEQRAFAVAVAPAVFFGDAWPSYALGAMREAGIDLPILPPSKAEDMELGERKLLLAKLWLTFAPKDRESFLRKIVCPTDLAKVAK